MDDWRWSAPDDDAEVRPRSDPACPSAGRALKKAFSASYDYFALTAGGSLLASLMLVPVGLVTARLIVLVVRGGGRGIAGWVLWLLLAGPVAWVLGSGLVCMAGRMLDRDEPSLLDIWRGVRIHWRASGKLGVLSALVLGALCADAVFFLTRNTAVALLGVPFAYLVCLWMMAMLYQLPLLASKQRGALWCARQSVLLMLDNTVFTVSICLVIIVVVGFSAVTWLALALWTPVWVAVVSQSALCELTAKYDALEGSNAEGSDGSEQ
ncbi:MAG: hypothetical protein ACUVTZ_13575 [Armatimonadota bacterium]